MRDNDLDFTIARLGECRIPSPMSGVRFTSDEERVLYHSTLERLKRLAGQGCRASRDGVRRSAAHAVLRSGETGVRDRDVRRSLPGVERRDPRGGPEPAPPLRREQGLRLSFRLRRPRAQDRARAARVDTRIRPSDRRERRIDARIRPEVPRTPRKWWITLSELGVGILFAIGGDGTLRGAQKIGEEAARRGLKISVIGIPKTIDNDISFVQRTFGFETAVTAAQRATSCGQRRGRSGAQRHRTREAHGPRFRVHRGVFGPGQRRGELLPGPRGAFHPEWVPVGAAADGSSAEATR